MDAATREALRSAIDRKRREQIDVPAGAFCGTLWGYRRGCRCSFCRKAAADYKRERRASGAITVNTHSNAGYNNGCRCDVCRAAHTAYSRALRRAKAS